jgi:pimeloyl-ACP methyl ester carboxylesterase
VWIAPAPATAKDPACHELDYDTEIAHYRHALDATLARYDWLDRDRLVIYGSSLGATVAPLVAQGRKVAGVMVQGGGALTYLERMIVFDRQQLERTGVPAAEIHPGMSRQIPFHVEYLLRGRDPDEIGEGQCRHGNAPRARFAVLAMAKHYGRPYAWHRQAARHNFLEAWTSLDAPVLVLYGEFDHFEGRHGHELIASAVNRAHPGRATFIEIPHMDHEGDVYDTVEDAYVWERQISGPPGTAAQLQAGPMLRWLRGRRWFRDQAQRVDTGDVNEDLAEFRPVPGYLHVTCASLSRAAVGPILPGCRRRYLQLRHVRLGRRRFALHPRPCSRCRTPIRMPPRTAAVVFQSTRVGGSKLFVARLDGTRAPAIDRGARRRRYAQIGRRDGTTVAFASVRNGDEDVWIVKADGTGARNVTNHPGSDSHPSLVTRRPTDRLLFYTRGRRERRYLRDQPRWFRAAAPHRQRYGLGHLPVVFTGRQQDSVSTLAAPAGERGNADQFGNHGDEQ